MTFVVLVVGFSFDQTSCHGYLLSCVEFFSFAFKLNIM